MQKDPIKIIHKFKNNNRRIQYRVYIYIGSHIPENIMNILEAIKDKDLYTSLNTISKDNYSLLENYYGKFWYYKIFLSYHIESQINIIHNNSVKHKTLESKYGKEWYKLHIVDNGDQSKLKKVAYSFSAEYYNYLLLNNKIKSHTKKMEMDFRTYGDIEKISFVSLSLTEKDEPLLGGSNLIKYGGKIEQSDNESEEKTDDEQNDSDDDDAVQEISEEDFEEQIEEDFDLDEITNLDPLRVIERLTNLHTLSITLK